MVVFGEAARPRVVAVGLGREHPSAEVVERYSGTVRYFEEDSEIRWASWDAMVTIGYQRSAPEHVGVLQIGGEPIGWRTSTPSSPAYRSSRYVRRVNHVGDELVVPDDLPQDLGDLVKKHLLPRIADADPAHYRYRLTPHRAEDDPDGYKSLLHDLDGYALAALYRPPAGAREVLFLPEFVADIGPWLLWLFKRWAAELPDVFPSEPEWTSDQKWMTHREIEAVDALAHQRAAFERVIDEQREAIVRAETEVQTVREEADASVRLLLTGTGDELADVVQQTLELFGFQVINVDEARPENDPKREDLRASDGTWTALCEVKGYTKGAKSSDLMKISQYATLYVKEIGNLPDATWYVANHNRNVDPSARGVLLAGFDDDIDVFAQQGGLAIDTRELFALRKAVEAGEMSADAAREWLMQARGRFEAPPPSS